MKLKRISIKTKDVQKITGQTLRQAQRLMTRVRNEFGKERHHIITIYELCAYLNLPVAEAAMQLNLEDTRSRNPEKEDGHQDATADS